MTTTEARQFLADSRALLQGIPPKLASVQAGVDSGDQQNSDLVSQLPQPQGLDDDPEVKDPLLTQITDHVAAVFALDARILPE